MNEEKLDKNGNTYVVAKVCDENRDFLRAHAYREAAQEIFVEKFYIIMHAHFKDRVLHVGPECIVDVTEDTFGVNFQGTTL